MNDSKVKRYRLGRGCPTNVSVTLWPTLVEALDLLREKYGYSRSLIIRTTIEKGVDYFAQNEDTPEICHILKTAQAERYHISLVTKYNQFLDKLEKILEDLEGGKGDVAQIPFILNEIRSFRNDVRNGDKHE